MRKKMVVALLAAMTLSFGTFGVVDASAEDQEGSRPGYVWVIDQKEQGHYEEVLVSPEEGHYEDREVVPEKGHWETVHHEEVGHYETVHHEEVGHYEDQQVQVGTQPIYETKRQCICNTCGAVIYTDGDSGDVNQAIQNHVFYHADLGQSCSYRFENNQVQIGEEPVYETQSVWVVDQEAYDEQVWVVDQEAYDEQIWIVDEEAVYDKVWVVDKEAVYENQWIVDVPEKGHWEPVSTDPEEPTDPDQSDNPDPETPETEEPTTPVEPETPDTETPDTENPDAEGTETPDTDNAGSNQEAVPTPEQTATDDSQATDKNKPQASGDTVTEDKGSASENTSAPQTGDPTNLGYLVSLAGSALAGGSALVWKFRKRK